MLHQVSRRVSSLGYRRAEAPLTWRLSVWLVALSALQTMGCDGNRSAALTGKSPVSQGAMSDVQLAESRIVDSPGLERWRRHVDQRRQQDILQALEFQYRLAVWPGLINTNPDLGQESEFAAPFHVLAMDSPPDIPRVSDFDMAWGMRPSDTPIQVAAIDLSVSALSALVGDLPTAPTSRAAGKSNVANVIDGQRLFRWIALALLGAVLSVPLLCSLMAGVVAGRQSRCDVRPRPMQVLAAPREQVRDDFQLAWPGVYRLPRRVL